MADENKNKMLDRCQSIITRLAGNQFTVKGWSITIATATLAYLNKDGFSLASVVALLPIVAFWILDAHYLMWEQQARLRYIKIAETPEEYIDFDLRPIISPKESEPENLGPYRKWLRRQGRALKGLIRGKGLFSDDKDLYKAFQSPAIKVFHRFLFAVGILVAFLGIPLVQNTLGLTKKEEKPSGPALRAFISYASDNQKPDVLAISNKLREKGIDCQIDQYLANHPPVEGFPAWSLKQMRLADFVLVVCSPGYSMNQTAGQDTLGILLQQQEVKDEVAMGGRSFRFVPVGFGPPKDIPDSLKTRASDYVDLTNESKVSKLIEQMKNSGQSDAPPLGK